MSNKNKIFLVALASLLMIVEGNIFLKPTSCAIGSVEPEIVIKCPVSFQWNPETKLCDAIDCEDSVTTPSEVVDSSVSPENRPCNGSIPAPVCPPHDEHGPAVHLPNPKDCTKFFQCDWGVLYPKDCPTGLHFDKNLQICNWPQVVGCACTEETEFTPSPAPEVKPTPCPEDSLTTPSEVVDSSVSPGDRPCNGSMPAPVCPPHDEHGPAVHLPNPKDCSKFFQCDWGVLYPKDCPTGLHFDKNLQICNWPEVVGCACTEETDFTLSTAPEVKPTTRPEDSLTTPSEVVDSSVSPGDRPCNGSMPAPVCPPHDEHGPAVHLPNPKDCTKFFQCDWGVLYPKDCPTGLHFDKNLQICNWPEVVGCACTEETDFTPSPAPEVKPTPCPEDSLTTPSEVVDSSVSPGDRPCNGSISAPVCPPHDEHGPAVHLPNPKDCTKFFQCDWGVLFPKNCPAGLHFDKNLQVCNWPKVVGCACTAETEFTPSPTPEVKPTPCPEDSLTTPSEVVDSSVSPGDRPCNGSIPAPVCPPHDEHGPAVHLPNPKDCTKFFQCDWGVLYPKDCPTGLHFDKNLQICNWPQVVGCACTEETEFTPSPAPEVKPTPCPEDSLTTPSEVVDSSVSPGDRPCNGSIPAPVCPPHDEHGPAVHLPNPKDCTKFFQCDWGVLYPKDCPTGLHFDKNLQICNWPEVVGCACTEETDFTPSPAPEVKPTPCPEDSLTTPSEVVDSSVSPGDRPCNGSISAPVCPPHDEHGPAVHLPNPKDCTKFFQCDWGVLYPKDCPAGLHFDKNLQVCNWPKVVGCACTAETEFTPSPAPEVKPTPCPEDSLTTPSEVVDSSVSPGDRPCNGSIPAPVCPPHDEHGPAVHLPNPKDCSKFFQCDWGVLYPKDCPTGLHFDKNLQICNWPEVVGCACTEETEFTPSPAPEVKPTTRPEDSLTTPSEVVDSSVSPGDRPCNGSISAPVCPPHDEHGPTVLLPNPKDCNKLFLCNWGVLFPINCPAGLHFDKNLQVCNFPEAVDCACTKETDFTPSPAPEVKPTPRPEDSLTTPSEVVDSSVSPGDRPCNGSIPAPVCPPHDEHGPAVHLPNPKDCTKFFQCDWGVLFPKNCPAGLHFDKNLQVCNWPKVVGCACTAETEFTPSPTPEVKPTPCPEDSLTTPSEVVDSSVSPGDRPCNGSIPAPVCPPHDEHGPAVHLPNPKDCSKFFQCDWGVLFPKNCPAGLHFDKNLQVCNWPEVVGCACTEETEFTPSPAPEVKPTPCPEDSLTTPSEVVDSSVSPGDRPCNGSIPAPVCPPHDEHGPAVHLPNPKDCSKFFQCDWGDLFPKNCPAGLHFDKNLQVCNWPEVVGCACTEETEFTPSPAPEVKPTPCPEDSLTTPSEVVDSSVSPGDRPCNGSISAPVCPPHDEHGPAVHLPNPKDCSKFFQCDWGVLFPKNCPAGLHFDKNLQVCNWPKAVDCACTKETDFTPSPAPEVKPTPRPEDSLTTPSEVVDSSVSPGDRPCNGSISAPVCPPHDEHGPAVHLPNPKDCSKFFQCDWGVLFPKNCPAGLHFDKNLQVCNWPKIVGCACT